MGIDPWIAVGVILLMAAAATLLLRLAVSTAKRIEVVSAVYFGTLTSGSLLDLRPAARAESGAAS